MANPFSELFAAKTQEYGLPEGYLDRTAGVESSYNPNAKNPNSSAGGLFQFIDGTAKQYGLADKYDPAAATDAAARLARDNAAALRNALGRDPTAGELYLAHQQGAGGAIKLLSNPDAPAESIVGSAAARLNGGSGLTAGQLAQKWTRKIDGGSAPLNPTITAAAERGRGPAADRPARGGMTAEGQMPMPQAMPPDLSNTNDAGARDFILREAGMAPGQSGNMTQQAMGGLGGLGGFRPPGAPPSAPTTSASPSAAPMRSIESMIPESRPNPLAFFGKPAMENQQAAADRQGKIALVGELERLGIPRERAVGLINTPEGLKLALAQVRQERTAAANKEAIGALAGGAPAAPAPTPAAPAMPQGPIGLQAPGASQPTGQPAAPVSVMRNPGLDGATTTDRAKMTSLLKVLVNPNVSKDVRDVAELQYKQVLEESKLTPSQKEYAQALAQGFGGTHLDYKKELAAAGRSTVSVDNRAEGAEAKGRGEGLAKRWNDIADDGVKANEDAILFQRFGDILGTVKTGKTTETLEKIRQATGLALDPNTDNVQALNSLINYVAPRLRVPGSGAQSDRELTNFLAAIPSLAGSPEGNQKILATLSGLIGYRRQRAAVAAEWQNGDISAKDAQAKIDAIPSPFSQPEKPRGAAAPQAATRPDGSSPPQPDGVGSVKVFTKADYDKLPAGAEYIDPTGQPRRKGGQ